MRVDEINNLRRKYGDTIEDIINYKDKISSRLEEIINRDEMAEELKNKLIVLEEELSKKADALKTLSHKFRRGYIKRTKIFRYERC